MITKNNNELLEQVKKLQDEIVQLKRRKRYGLVWEDKPEKFDAESKNALPVLKEKGGKFKDIKDEKNPDGGYNILIEGDNYHSLSVLNYTHRNKIDVIYIDPPYNTGNKDFVYNDYFVDKEDSFRHSKWLSFMSKRLSLAKELLADDGVIFISIGDDENATLRILCDEVFGENNFITKFIWEKTQHFGRQKVNSYSNGDYIITYAKKLKNSSENKKELLVESIKEEFEDAPLYNASNPEKTVTIPKEKVLFRIDDGMYSAGVDKKFKLKKKVIVKNGKNKNDLILQFKSRWSQKKVDEQLALGAHFLIKSNKFSIRVVYGSGKKSYESPKQIIFTNNNNDIKAVSHLGDKVGTNETASNELSKLIGEQNIFSYPKPVSLISYLLSLLFDYKNHKFNKNITVLDFFAGSGTTGQAVLDFNKRDNGNRKFILCTNNENKICEDVTWERIKKVSEGYKKQNGDRFDGLGGNIKYLKTDFIKIDNNSDNLKEKTVEASTEILCLKENTFNKVKNDYKKYKIKIFENKNKYTAILFDLFYFDEFVNELKRLEDKKVSIYVFSYTKDFSAKEFGDLNIDFTVEAIPEKVLELIKKYLISRAYEYYT